MVGRTRWLVTSVLVLLAGALTTLSTSRHWNGCDLSVSPAPCLPLRAKTYGLPWWGVGNSGDAVTTGLSAGAAVLLCLAWLTVVGWARRSAARLVVAAVIGCQPLLVAVWVELTRPDSGSAPGAAMGWLTWPAEILVVPMLLGAGWILDEAPAHTLRLILLGWAVTAFGPLHHFVDYVASSQLFPTAAGLPPLMGYVTATSEIVVGVVLMAFTLMMRGDPEEDGEEESGRDGYTLAA